jgi:hypothetical protein
MGVVVDVNPDEQFSSCSTGIVGTIGSAAGKSTYSHHSIAQGLSNSFRSASRSYSDPENSKGEDASSSVLSWSEECRKIELREDYPSSRGISVFDRKPTWIPREAIQLFAV